MSKNAYWEKQRRFLATTAMATALLLVVGMPSAIPQKAYAATVTWDGGGNGVTFSDPQNWDTDTVPTSTDSIVIGPAAATLVFLDTDFTIASQGSITVQGLGRLEIEAGKTLTNLGDLTVANNVEQSYGEDNFGINNYGNIDTSGTIKIENAGLIGLINNSTGTMTNSGTINIQNPGFAGIFSPFRAITNSGTINIENTNGYGIYGTLDNSGTVMVANGGTNTRGIYAFTTGPLDNTGEITVANTGTDTIGIVSPAFNIYGVVNINSGGSIVAFDDPITVFCGGQLNNNGGTITGTVVDQNPCDSTAPVITILGSNPAIVEKDQTYTDAGATATDDIDTTPTLTSTNTVNTAVVGTYTVTYTAEDDAGNTSTATRTVNVVLKPIAVSIDIKPGGTPNTINLKTDKIVTVALLGSTSFDVNSVNQSTLKFGGHTLQSPIKTAFQNVNKDKYTDLIMQFNVPPLGFAVTDTQGCLPGATQNGTPFIGCDSVRILNK